MISRNNVCVPVLYISWKVCQCHINNANYCVAHDIIMRNAIIKYKSI